MYVFDVGVTRRKHDGKFMVEILTLREEEFARAYYNKHKYLPAFLTPQWVVVQVFEGYRVAKEAASEWRSKLWRGGHPYKVPYSRPQETAT